MVSGNNNVAVAKSRIGGDEKVDDFPPKPKARYTLKLEFATERIITWAAISVFHGEKNGNVKERDRDNAIGTRNAVLWDCETDKAKGSIQFKRGWMLFQSLEQIDHLLKCFAWQLSDEGPGIPLEEMVLADDIIKELTILSAKATADREKAEAEAKARARADKPKRRRAAKS